MVKDYGQIKGEPISQRTVVETKMAAGDHARLGKVYLTQATAGWEPAGSMARWTNGYWSSTFFLDGASHGKRFKTEPEARAHFDGLTA